MIEKLLDDVNKALDADCYFAALALALTLPDICGKAEYPQKGTSRRYKDWYDEYIGKYEQSPLQEYKMPYLSGEVVHSLRNSLLHQGTPSISTDDIKEERNKIDHFELVIESKKPFDTYVDAAGIQNESYRTYSVNVRRLCFVLCACARGYYKENRDKFNFFNCTIIDWDFEARMMQI